MVGYGVSYAVVSLGSQSAFVGLENAERIYGADYDRGETVAHHNEERHEYLVSKTILDSDLVDLLASAAEGSLRPHVEVAPATAVTVACAAPGYPDAPRTGDPIVGLEAAASEPGVELFFAGVADGPEGGFVTAGGRVLWVTGRGEDLTAARDAAYRGVAHLSWPGLQVRTDIAGTGGA